MNEKVFINIVFAIPLILVAALLIYFVADTYSRDSSDVREETLYPNCAKNADIGYWSLSRSGSNEGGIFRMTDAEYKTICVNKEK